MFDFIITISIKTGIILIPLFFSGFVGWTLLFNLYFFIKDQDSPSKVMRWEKLLEALDKGNVDSLRRGLEKYTKSTYAKYVMLLVDNLKFSERHLIHLNDVFMIQNISVHQRRLQTVKVLAGLAPLMGLLGTVNGMINTFEIISLYGNSNPVLMADGISEALLTTQSGLIVAFPLLFAHVIFNNRFKKLKNSMTDVLTEICHHKKMGKI